MNTAATAKPSKRTAVIEATEATATLYRASAERSRSPSTGDDAHPDDDDLGGDIFEVMTTPSTWASSCSISWAPSSWPMTAATATGEDALEVHGRALDGPRPVRMLSIAMVGLTPSKRPPVSSWPST